MSINISFIISLLSISWKSEKKMRYESYENSENSLVKRRCEITGSFGFANVHGMVLECFEYYFIERICDEFSQ